MKIQLICWIVVLCILCHCLPAVFAETLEKADGVTQNGTVEKSREERIPPDELCAFLSEYFLTPDSREREYGLLSVDRFSSAELQLFQDVQPEDYYYEAVRWAVLCGITNGTTATTFSPGAFCTRKHIITFIWRGCERPFQEGWTYPFADGALNFGDKILETLRNHPEINPDLVQSATWAYLKEPPKLEQGERVHNQVYFRPDNVCTRGEAVIYLWKAANRPNADMKYAEAFTDIHTDYQGNIDYLLELPKAVAWAAENEITLGRTVETEGGPEQRFVPADPTTRGNIVTFLYRFAQTPAGKQVLQLNENT